MMKLYVYDHCPFCIKARMIFGLKNLPVDVVFLANDDEATPITMIGKKMVPILQKEDDTYMPESMDIVHYIEREYAPAVLTGTVNALISLWLQENSGLISKLYIPRTPKIPLPEFATQAAQKYFTEKKEAYYGSFAALLEQTPELLMQINQSLQALDTLILSEKACNQILSEDDIHLFAALHNLSMAKGVIYPDKVDQYRKNMSEQTKINLYNDIAI